MATVATKPAGVKKTPQVKAAKAKAKATTPTSTPTPPRPAPPSAIATAPPLHAAHDEQAAPRDISRLLRYGEKFGARRIDIRWLPTTLTVSGTTIALGDPGASARGPAAVGDRPAPPGASARVLERTVAPGRFRVMLAIAKDAAGGEQVAAVVVHVGRPPIARWTVAHFLGQKEPRSPDSLPVISITGDTLAIGSLSLPVPAGNYTAYWAIDATDKPVCLVVDLDVLTQKEWKAKPT